MSKRPLFVHAAALASLTMSAAATIAGEIHWRNPSPMSAPRLAPADALLQLASKTQARRIVVQFNRPMTPGLRAQLENAGVHLLSYLSENAFFATLSPNVDVIRATTGGALQSAMAIQPEWKLHAALLNDETQAWPVVEDGADPVIGAYVMLHPDADLGADGMPLVTAHGGVVRDFIVSVNAMVVEGPVSGLKAMADADVVQWIEPALPRMSGTNAENRAITGANVVQSAPYNLNGAGVTVLVYDGGTARATHQDFGGRLTVHDASGQHYHSTHVAGTIGGSGAASGGNNRGMAPGVTMLSYGFEYDGSGTFLYTNPGDIEADFTQAINLGADISNASIGTNTESNFFSCSFQGDYGITDALIDAVARGAVSNGAPFRLVWAAGNERQGSRCDVEGFGDYYSSAPPAGAKNHLSIGALNANDDSMTSFSSWGPTDDGRLKPDFSAPGCQSNGDNGVTSTDSAGDSAYTVLCGTSMASPTACGLAALLMQDYRNQFGGPDPRNSTLKVLFAHNAVDRGNPGPDYQFGYGSIRIQPTIDFMRTGNFTEDQASQGETVQYRVTVAPGTSQLKVTLAWDDPSGTPNVIPSLVNDLDLRVYDPGANRWYPWTLNPANPSANAVQTQEDHRNNIEQVLVNNPTPGDWLVEIYGNNVPDGPQPYSLAGSPTLTEYGVRIRLPDGTPTLIAPGDAESFPVQISSATESIIAGSQKLRFRYDGGAFQEIPLTPTGGNDYLAQLPPPVCGATPEFYVVAQGSVSGDVTNPPGAPGDAYAAAVGEVVVVANENMESGAGWSVTNTAITDGGWDRGVPVNCNRGDPPADYDGSGQCWLTDNSAASACNSDVDGGPTTLTSPAYDLSALDSAVLSVALWFSNDDNDIDNLTVQFSDNNGGSWTTVDALDNNGWLVRQYNVEDFVGLSSAFRARFVATDNPNDSVTEAAVDRLRIESQACFGGLDDCNGNGIVDADDIAAGRSADTNSNGVPDECDPPVKCPGDLNGDNQVDVEDLSILLSNYGAGSAGAEDGDMNGDGDVDLEDLSAQLAFFGVSC